MSLVERDLVRGALITIANPSVIGACAGRCGLDRLAATLCTPAKPRPTRDADIIAGAARSMPRTLRSMKLAAN
jgi:hypothetical protein